MEDVFSVAYQQTDDEKDLEYAFFGIFDGHGGKEAALFAKEHLMDAITKNKSFWAENDDQAVLQAIREGFLSTQQAMWKDLPNWQRTASGLPSTAGTTASVCFIKKGKLFVGHCGDSGIVLGQEDKKNAGRWKAKPLTTDHKPESDEELSRIEKAGGKVINKSGVPRVVWYRPRTGHQGPVRRSTQIDEIPFLAVARALGDLWSYNSKDDVFIVSPEPDLHVYELDVMRDRCLVLATDGAWNVITPEMAVNSAYEAEKNNEWHMINPKSAASNWINPSKKLVDLAIQRWQLVGMRADNTSIVTVLLDPPGPPRAQVLRRLHAQQQQQKRQEKSPPALPPKPNSANPKKGIAIISRFPNSRNEGEKKGTNLVGSSSAAAAETTPNRIVHDSLSTLPQKLKVNNQSNTSPNVFMKKNDSPPPPPIPQRKTTLPPIPPRPRSNSNDHFNVNDGDSENQRPTSSTRTKRVSPVVAAAAAFPSRVLRPRNSTPTPPPKPKQQQTTRRSYYQKPASSSALPLAEIGGGLKRKRRSLEVFGAQQQHQASKLLRGSEQDTNIKRILRNRQH